MSALRRIGKIRWAPVLPGVLFFAASAAVVASHAAFLAFVVRPGAEDRTLHYTTVFGIDLVGAGYRLYLLPGVGLAALLANAVIALVLRRDRVAPVLAASTLVLEVALTVATLAVTRVSVP